MLATMQCTCGKHLDAHTHKPGDPAQCPACGNVFIIGEPVKTTTAIQTGTPPTKPAPVPLALAELPSIENPKRSWRERILTFAVVVSIVMGLSVVGYFSLGSMDGGDTQRDVASTQVRGPLTAACKAFEIKHGRWPVNLEELLLKIDHRGPFLENADCLRDPWGNRYRYDLKGPMNKGTMPDIWTEVPNDGRKIGNWPTIRE